MSLGGSRARPYERLPAAWTRPYKQPPPAHFAPHPSSPYPRLPQPTGTNFPNANQPCQDFCACGDRIFIQKSSSHRIFEFCSNIGIATPVTLSNSPLRDARQNIPRSHIPNSLKQKPHTMIKLSCLWHILFQNHPVVRNAFFEKKKIGPTGLVFFFKWDRAEKGGERKGREIIFARCQLSGTVLGFF